MPDRDRHQLAIDQERIQLTNARRCGFQKRGNLRAQENWILFGFRQISPTMGIENRLAFG
jgi:hypothetical protein